MAVKETEQEIFQLDDRLYRLVQHDSKGTFVDSYLIIGDNLALVIDLQRVKGCLLSTIRQLTDKPLIAVITHGHYDHLGANAPEFIDNGIPIWIYAEEYKAFEREILDVLGDREDLPLRFMTEGQEFDLGGYIVEAGTLGGHTPRGCMLLERSRGWLFSGDALGNRSFYMQLPGSSSLEDFAIALELYLETVRPIANLKVFTGHGIGETYYGLPWAEQIRVLTGDLVSGRRRGVPVQGRWGECLCLDAEVFPEGYLYREDHVLNTAGRSGR